MVRALAITETISYGVLFYSFAVLVVPMREALGATTAQVSVAMSLALAVSGGAAPLVGRWVDRHGARWLMTGGSMLAGVSVLAWSRAQSLGELYLAFAGIGLASAAVLYEPAFAVINRWFRRDRARAMLAMTVIAGFSSTIFVPLVQGLVDAMGWRDALVVLAAVVGACALPHALLLRRAPHDVGLEPDGVPSVEVPDEALSTSPATGNRQERIVRRLTASAALHTIAVTVVAVHLVGYLHDDRVEMGLAAVTAGSLGVMSVAGRVAFTSLAARLGLARVAGLLVSGQAAGVLALLTVPGPVGPVLFVVLFGAGSGVMTIARPAVLGDNVPRSRFAAASGRQAMITTVGRVAAPFVAGSVITTMGYVPTLLGVAVACLGAGAVLLALESAPPASAGDRGDCGSSSRRSTVPGPASGWTRHVTGRSSSSHRPDRPALVSVDEAGS